MMKRNCMRLLALLLVLIIPSAHAAMGTLTFGEDSQDAGAVINYAESAAFVKDTVYFAATPSGAENFGTQLYAWKGGEEAPVALELILEMSWSSEEGIEGMDDGIAADGPEPGEFDQQDGEYVEEQPAGEDGAAAADPRENWPRCNYSFLTTDGERLLVFDGISGALSELVIEGTKVTPKLILTATMPEEEKNFPYRSYRTHGIQAGKLILSSDFHDDMGHQRKNPIMTLDLTTGEVKYLPVDLAINAVPYREDSVMLVVQDFEKSYDQVAKKRINPDYVIYNLVTGQKTEEGTLLEDNSMHSKMLYLKDADAVVYINRGKIMEMINGFKEIKQVGYTTREYAESIGQLADGTLGVLGSGGAGDRPDQPGLQP